MNEADAAVAIEAHVAKIRADLDLWARHMAARYNGPVYLLGSVLHNPQPRDIDIRIVVRDHEFAARYGQPLHRLDPIPDTHPLRRRTSLVAGNFCDWNADGPTQRWIDDVAKFNAYLSVKFNEHFDAQVVPDSWWHDRIYPAPIKLAAPSGHWFFYSALVPDPAVGGAA